MHTEKIIKQEHSSLRPKRAIRLKCLLVYPKFTANSFWNYKDVCKLEGASYPAAPLGLITVAALLPDNWDLKLIDCNSQDLEDHHLEWADVILSGGMISQQVDHRKLIQRVKKTKKLHIVGGPDASSSPHLYDEATHLVLGEAEVSLPLFLKDHAIGKAKHIYDPKEQKADMSKSPVPRFDLLDFKKYLHVGIQFARGCPFNCEFCDIIELFGRTPRAKSPDQIIEELEALHRLGYRGHVDLVDDNFIGNRSSVKKLLRKMIPWLESYRWPFEFSTEATINLADDVELMSLMQEAGFWIIFVGIESPDEETLKATQKGQNTKRSIPDSIQKIYEYGMIVNAGYIVGIDAERGSVARGILECIEKTSIPVNMVGLMTALPNTQLTRRLFREGRLEQHFDLVAEGSGDQSLGGLNFKTKRPRIDILSDFKTVLTGAFSHQSYFDRVLHVGLNLNCDKRRLNLPIKKQLNSLRALTRLVRQMDSEYRSHFFRVFYQVLRQNPKALRYTVGLMALYLHFGPFKDYIIEQLQTQINEILSLKAKPSIETNLDESKHPLGAFPLSSERSKTNELHPPT